MILFVVIVDVITDAVDVVELNMTVVLCPLLLLMFVGGCETKCQSHASGECSYSVSLELLPVVILHYHTL